MKFREGQLVWFLKSMRMCRFVAYHDDGTVTVETLDTGKGMVATPQGIEAVFEDVPPDSE